MRAIALIAAIGVGASFAQAEERRDLGAHEHGVGALNIAFEGGVVAMELEAPGADIVGFEHLAESAADRAKVDAAIATLAKPLELFRLPDAAKCTLVAAEVELHGEEDAHHDEHAHDEHHADHQGEHQAEGEGHEEHAEHKEEGAHGEEHAEAHDEDHHEEASHTEFHAEYRLTCAAPDAINRIEFGYFETFPNAEELEVQMISDTGSNGFEVERDDPVLDLRGLI